MLAPILSTVIALAQAEVPSPVPSPPTVGLQITGRGEVCLVAVAARTFRLPEDARRLVKFLRASAARDAVAEIIHVDESVAYKCVGHAIFLTQRAGLTFNRIGFIPDRE